MSFYWLFQNEKEQIPMIYIGSLLYLNSTISFGVQPIILHSFSTVKRVMFLFFFKLSKVLLSIPDFSRKYCVTPFCSIVRQSGL